MPSKILRGNISKCVVLILQHSVIKKENWVWVPNSYCLKLKVSFNQNSFKEMRICCLDLVAVEIGCYPVRPGQKCFDLVPVTVLCQLFHDLTVNFILQNVLLDRHCKYLVRELHRGLVLL